VFDAAEANDDGALARLLDNPAAAAALLSTRDAYGWTPLMAAAASGAGRAVALLLRHPAVTPALVALADDSGRDASAVARRCGHATIAAALEAAASPDPPPLPPPASSSPAATAAPEPDATFVCPACQQLQSERQRAAHETSIPHLHACQYRVAGRPFHLTEVHRGFQLLTRLGWGETGLGPREDGRLAPVKTTLRPARAGLGAAGVPPARVTHFAAHDAAAVKQRAPPPPPAPSKRAAAAAMERERAREVKLRRLLNEA
jgi:hypothetical protein